MNFVLLVGRLGNTPEVKNFENGKVVNFSLATNGNYKDKTGKLVEKTDWHKVVANGKLAEIAEKYLKKGDLISLQGKLQTREYEKEGHKFYITEVILNKLEMLTPKAKEEESHIHNETADDDIPF